jgi:hypothetical protein
MFPVLDCPFGDHDARESVTVLPFRPAGKVGFQTNPTQPMTQSTHSPERRHANASGKKSAQLQSNRLHAQNLAPTSYFGVLAGFPKS